MPETLADVELEIEELKRKIKKIGLNWRRAPLKRERR